MPLPPDQQAHLDTVRMRFPATFRLHGEDSACTFRINPARVHLSPEGDTILHIQKLGDDGNWKPYSRASAGALRAFIK